MRFSPSSEEQTMLEHLSQGQRFEYAIPRICECEEVWSLGDDNGWLIRDVGETAIISIWPYRQMALECALDEMADSRPISVSLEHFIYSVLKQCQESEISMEVCPAPGQPGHTLSAAELYELLDGMMESETYFIEG